MKQRLLIVILLSLFPLNLFGGTRDKLHQQGFLLAVDGTPVEGTHDMIFRLYDSPQGENALWEESVLSQFNGGFYSVDLGDVTPLPDKVMETISDLYLGLSIDDDTELKPRFRVTSVPFARVAEKAIAALSVDDSIVLPRLFIQGFGEVVSSRGEWVGPPITGLRGPAGAQGLQGVAGATGPAGPTGPQGAPGTPTTITAGSGLTGGGTGSSVSLSVGAGTGMSVNEDSIGITPGGVSTVEILDETITNSDLSPTAAISGSKINPNFGSQQILTTGDISAGGGYRMMIGPFQESNSNATKDWDVGQEGVEVTRITTAWAGSIVGVSLFCGGAVSQGSLTVAPTLNGSPISLQASLATGSQAASTNQSKDTPGSTFTAGQGIGCRATPSGDLSPLLDCVCAVFVEM